MNDSAAATPQPPLDPTTDQALLALGRAVIETERDAMERLLHHLDPAFAQACRLILGCRGRVVVTGMGKSGHIGGKIAATLASTGTPAFFVHPGEASHGDLGMIVAEDTLIALSYSGETDELLTILPRVRRLHVPVIALTGQPQSRLAREATVHLDVGVAVEACPLGLAPTASTTATLVMGDALAVALLQARGFTREDFARSHPSGALGRRLLLHVEDIMHRDPQIPQVTPDATISAALVEMTRTGLGMTAVVEPDETVAGIYTDGDLRRTLDRSLDIHQTPIRAVMTPDCHTIEPERLAAEAVERMETHAINALLVVDASNRLIGALNMHDLLRARVV